MANTFTEELVDDMATAAVITAKGTDGFFDQMPDITTTPALAVYNNGGISAHRSPVQQCSVGFRTRGATYDSAVVLAKSVRDRYHQMVDTSLATRRILWALADGEPASIGRDSANRSLVAFNTTFGVVDIPEQTCNLVVTMSNIVWGLRGSNALISYTSNVAVRGWVRFRLTNGPGEWDVYRTIHSTYITSHTTETAASGLELTTDYDFQFRLQPEGGVTETHPQCGEQVFHIITGDGTGDPGGEGTFIQFKPV